MEGVENLKLQISLKFVDLWLWEVSGWLSSEKHIQ